MIEKKSASQILNLGGTYTVLPNKSIGLIQSPLTLGIWTYFVSRPPTWQINQKNVCERFDISVRQYYKIIKELKTVDLCREYTKRDIRKLLGKMVVVVSSVDDWVDAEKRLDNIGKTEGYYLTFPANGYKLGHFENKVNPSKDKGSCELNGFVNFTNCQTHDSCTSRFVTTHDCDTSQNAKHSNNRYKEIKENNKASSSKEGFPEEQQCNANDRAVLAAADLLIGSDLTDNQRQHIISQLNTFAKDSNIATDGIFSGMGIDAVADIIGKAILDSQQFKRCANKFEYKLNSILNEIARGNFGRIIADVKALQSTKDLRHGRMDSKPTPEQELQASMKRLQNERQCQMQALTGPMAQYPDFVSATQSCISKLDQDIADIQCELDTLTGASTAQSIATSQSFSTGEASQ